jgi:hypothetical protein
LDVPDNGELSLVEPKGRGRDYLWLCLATSGIAFLGFSFTYFGPMLAGEYPPVSATVHIHGWTFFLWYLLLPVQAGLVSMRRVSIHRSLGTASTVLALAMVVTGQVVIGTQMELTRSGDTIPFWEFLGPAVFVTLVLFAGFYVLALRYRRKRALHKRFILLASTGALGAAGFRVIGQVIGLGAVAGVTGIVAPNLLILVAIGLDIRRGEGFHPVYRWGLPVSLLLEVGVILLTPTPAGEYLAAVLAWTGRLLAPFY